MNKIKSITIKKGSMQHIGTLVFATAMFPPLGILGMYALRKKSKWYYLFFSIGILVFICWCAFIARHFKIVYIP